MNLPWSGSRLIGGGRQIEVTRDEVREVLVEGYFPMASLDAGRFDRPRVSASSACRYAPDPAVTRYLAAFLTAHRHVALDDADAPTDHDPARPDVVLVNGGLFESPVLRQRLIDVLTGWFSSSTLRVETSNSTLESRATATSATAWSPIMLDNERLDLAVARGAAYYGMVRRGQGVRIAAGLARTYYIGVVSARRRRPCASCRPGSSRGRTWSWPVAVRRCSSRSRSSFRSISPAPG